MSSWLTYLASVGMAVGPPLVYADQAASIIRKKDSTGFSRDVCAILLIANITRCFFWLGNHFETPLLIQSLLMILAQLALLYICLEYRPRIESSHRPFSFWRWPNFSQHVEFLAALIIFQTIAFLILGRMEWFITTLGFVALGLESTLPLPQLVSNYRQRSLYGFRASTLIGWVGGDAFKTAYFFIQNAPLQFKVCAVFQLSIDCVIVLQRFVYGNAPPPVQMEDDIEPLRLHLDEAV